MLVSNAVNPTGAQLQALLSLGVAGPVTMLNLLKFKDKAAYDAPGEPELSGREAYMRYGEAMMPFVIQNGGRILFNGPAHALIIGAVEPVWDAIALVEYPSAADFVRIATSPEVAAIAHHRKAGLEGQLLICTSAA